MSRRSIEAYTHSAPGEAYNSPVDLVPGATDPAGGRKTYQHDRYQEPELQWVGKTERTSFEVPTVSVHVHERIDPRTIVEAVRRRNGPETQQPLFAAPEQNRPIRQAIEFNRGLHPWTNRLILGDSLLVMNSLLETEGMAGKVQTIYIDPPYGIRYELKFQPFVNRREVAHGKDRALTQEPETLRAFPDTWELGIHSWLSYLRDRLLLARHLLSDSGSVFVQIGENVDLVSGVVAGVFGRERLSPAEGVGG